MGDLTVAQAASKAGLPDAYLDRLIELGIVKPDADGRLTNRRRFGIAAITSASGARMSAPCYRFAS